METIQDNLFKLTATKDSLLKARINWSPSLVGWLFEQKDRALTKIQEYFSSRSSVLETALGRLGLDERIDPYALHVVLKILEQHRHKQVQLFQELERYEPHDWARNEQTILLALSGNSFSIERVKSLVTTLYKQLKADDEPSTIQKAIQAY